MKNICIAILIGLGMQVNGQDWSPAGEKIKSPWSEKIDAENVWQEYPRPQMQREGNWINLNGIWNFELSSVGDIKPVSFNREILVPFCIESSLSGVQEYPGSDQVIWYQKVFQLPENWKKKQVLLHFEAVDWKTEVWINGKAVGIHKGGFDPFSFNISKWLKKGDNELVVSVWDPTDEGTQPRSKQVKDPGGIWYTPVTGIWQTVWLEAVNKLHFENVYPRPDIDNNMVTILYDLEKPAVSDKIEVTVFDKKKPVLKKEFPCMADIRLEIDDPILWTPGFPHLYEFTLKLIRKGKVLDEVDSYFAMRKVSKGKDKNGFERIMLNNEPIFNYGTLDQGWWPDGLLTPPSDEAMVYDIKVLKNMGFNTIRKHIKVEPARYYYYTDKLGMLVWQDMPSGFKRAERAVQHVKPEAEKDWARPETSAVQFERELSGMINHLKFFPSINVWVVFNEGWGQYETKRLTEYAQFLDNTRIINSVSGWADRGVGDMNDAHQYPGPGMEPSDENPGRIIVLGEFGGLGHPVENHLWAPDKRNWGYRTYTDNVILIQEYAKLMHHMKAMKSLGLGGAIYTQTTDVEVEVNGLMSYDREVIKIPVDLLRVLHQGIYDENFEKASYLVKDSETEQGKLMLKKEGLVKEIPTPVNIPENEPAEFLKCFTVTEKTENLGLKIYARGDVKVWLNDQLILDKFISTKRHYDYYNVSEFSEYLIKGNNEIKFSILNKEQQSTFDFGLFTF